MVVFFEGTNKKQQIVEEFKNKYVCDFLDFNSEVRPISDFYNRQSKVIEIASKSLFTVLENRIKTKNFLTICNNLLYTSFREYLTTRKERNFLVNFYSNNIVFKYLRKEEDIKIVFFKDTDYNDTVIMDNLDTQAFNSFFSKFKYITRNFAIQDFNMKDLEKKIF